MARFQPVMPSLKQNLVRRRSRTWQILGLIVILFLLLTLMTMRYLPNIVIDPVSIIKNQDFGDIFVPPIPRPPMDWPNRNHNHSNHLSDEQSKLKAKIQQDHRNPIETNSNKKSNEKPKDIPKDKTSSNGKLSDFNGMSIGNLSEYFHGITIEQLQQIKSNEIRREKVREMILHAYSNYAKYGWGSNEHRPISKTGHGANVFGSNTLGITIIDSLDTVYLADLKDFYQKSRQWIETQFNVNVDSEVSAFEINIRLVGGFLAIYALTNDKLYLDKAQLVADHLLPAFNTQTGIPYALVNLVNGGSKNWNWAAGGCAILSELGTMHLEFQYLTQLTGKDVYLQKVEKIRKVVLGAAENNLYYNYIHPETGRWCQKHASLGALGDSFYEYLLKSWLLSGKKDEQARSMYENAMKAAEESMLRKTPTSNLMYFGELKSGRLDPQMGHLTCFVGGLYVLSSISSAIPSDNENKHQMEIGQSIGKTCRESYIRTASGLGPEAFHFERSDVEAKSLRDNEKYYILRPETIETWFYLWRSTHDQIYRDWAWDAIVSLEKHCRVDGGYSGIKDVYSVPVQHDDVQQSFFIAETLKYLLLIFSDDSFIPLDQYVFNTEAHPFRIRTS